MVSSDCFAETYCGWRGPSLVASDSAFDLVWVYCLRRSTRLLDRNSSGKAPERTSSDRPGQILGLDPDADLDRTGIGELIADGQDFLVVNVLAANADNAVLGLEALDFALGLVEIGTQRS
jgi:hypothetical protein